MLAVQLLLKEAGCAYKLPVVPLFETLDDPNRAPEVIKGLLDNDFYRTLIESRLMVMIGYSDSARDFTGAAPSRFRMARCDGQRF